MINNRMKSVQGRVNVEDAWSRKAIERILDCFPKCDQARVEWQEDGHFDPEEVPGIVYFRMIEELMAKVEALEIGDGEDN